MQTEARKSVPAWLWIVIVIASSLMVSAAFKAGWGAGERFGQALSSPAGDERKEPTKLTMPDRLAGHDRRPSPGAGEGVLHVALLQALPELESIGTAGYPGGKDLIIAGMAEGKVTNPHRTLDYLGSRLPKQGSRSADFNIVDAGPLGGAARCGWTSITTVPSNVCIWADANTVGAVIWIDDQFKSHSTAEFHAIRAELQKP